jgi:hypothetical protein
VTYIDFNEVSKLLYWITYIIEIYLCLWYNSHSIIFHIDDWQWILAHWLNNINIGWLRYQKLRTKNMDSLSVIKTMRTDSIGVIFSKKGLLYYFSCVYIWLYTNNQINLIINLLFIFG